MIHPTWARKHKLNVGCIGPIHIIEAISDLEFVVEDLRKTRTEVIYAQRLLSYPAQQRIDEISKELLEYAEHMDASTQIGKNLNSVRMREGEYEINVLWKVGMTSKIEHGSHLPN